MSQTPLLSIVAAVYNGEKFLAQFFECIEQQQLDSYELILVNDGSTDNSLAVIAEWQERLQNVQVLEQENQGVSVARNTGLAAASGKYLAFPDIDDKLYPACIARCWRWPRKNISISLPATAPMCTKSAARATRSSHWIACPRRMCCRAMSGLSRPWTRGSFCTSPGLIPGTYVRPHRHPHTFELLLPLRGRFVVLNFDDRGTVTHRAILGETCTVLEMAAGTWHAVLSLDTGGIIFEVKHGGYQPVAADDYAHWAPAEGEPGTTELMAWYAQAQVGDSTFAV
ncbi:glycosyltransferase [Klebsiella pneumoniae]|uniref:Glycosyltransferase n=2 Tax=Klebsiella pneumoniae TaxID=573 RepID=A0A377UQ36_KLEPN|nr:glycosyltransferase [Klebsiella pneumoniae]